MNKNNIYILTEESISINEITKIIRELKNKKNIHIEFKNLTVSPTIIEKKFKHQYKIKNFISNDIEEILIYGVGPAKGGSSKSPFVDFLVFLQRSKPSPEQLFKNCIFAIEATKTNNKDSRNTSLGQRASKFVHLNYFLEKEEYETTPIMYKTHEQIDDTPSVNFIGRLLNHLPVKTEFWGTKNFIYEKFKNLDELINEKNNISATNDRANDTPIFIEKEIESVSISGRLSNPGSTGKKKNRYTGKIGHDPNQGQLSLIAKSIRDFGFKKKIIIKNHDLIPEEVSKQTCKFIKFANYINFEIENCHIQKLIFNEKYFKYLTKNNEKIASILAQVILTNKGMQTIFENHGGCEKSFIRLDLFDKNNKYIEFPKKYSEGARKIPDLIMFDEKSKEIYLYEAKTAINKQKGLDEIKLYKDLENDILSKFYPNFVFKRRLIIQGGSKDFDNLVTFQIDEMDIVHKKDEFLI